MYSPVSIIDSTKPQYFNKFGICRKKLLVSFTEPPSGVDSITWFDKGLEAIIDYVKEDALESDKVGFTFTSPHFHGGDAHVAFMPASQISSNTLLHVVGGLMQSNRNENASWSSTFGVEVTRIRMPGYSNLPLKSQNQSPSNLSLKTPSQSSSSSFKMPNPNDYEDFKKYCIKKRSVVWIDNSEDLSLPRAIVVGKAILDKDPEYELIRKNRKNRQTLKAKEMLKKMDITIPKGGPGISEIGRFWKHLENYNLKIYQYNPNGNESVFEGTSRGVQNDIKLIRCNGHYNLITK